MSRSSLYDQEIQKQTSERIKAITADSAPVWGSMGPGQMMAHCAETIEVTNGEKELSKAPLVARVFKGMIRSSVMGDKPFRKNSPTHPQYLKKEDCDIEEQRERLISVIDRFVEIDKADDKPREHPFFGMTTHEERGWSMYKHLDHHLKQFGV